MYYNFLKKRKKNTGLSIKTINCLYHIHIIYILYIFHRDSYGAQWSRYACQMLMWGYLSNYKKNGIRKGNDKEYAWHFLVPLVCESAECTELVAYNNVVVMSTLCTLRTNTTIKRRSKFFCDKPIEFIYLIIIFIFILLLFHIVNVEGTLQASDTEIQYSVTSKSKFWSIQDINMNFTVYGCLNILLFIVYL